MWVIEPPSIRDDLTIPLEFPCYFHDSNTHKKTAKVTQGLTSSRRGGCIKLIME